MPVTDYEKLGVFYLGRVWDESASSATETPLLYDARDLVTHAVCVGMTGSGKTGLGVTLLEEAAIDGIPAIVIDPKGDMANLMLAFPDLRPEDFRPWVDPAEASRAGRTPEEHAAATATLWRDGLAAWGQDPSRIARYRNAAEAVVYTPGSSAGRPLSVLRSMSAPPDAVRADTDALRERIGSSVSGLLALVGVDADPVQSREHILLSNILEARWTAGRDVGLDEMIREIQSPPFERVGVFDVESFFPARERTALAMRLNNLIASPGFAGWLEGDPLDVSRLLCSTDGRPRISIVSIAHLSEAERMFLVTLLLSEVVAWMRSQSGTTSLRALLYMDEVFGYFPPVSNPPSKTPMLTLLKQARAYGLGVVLATQNPVDLDYKGLSNAGTWFLGRLQTQRDKERVIDGLAGASDAAIDRESLDRTLSGLGKRVFLLHNVHEDRPELFQTRWALSYLRGPMTRDQIRALNESALAPPPSEPPVAPAAPAVAAGTARPAPLPPEAGEGVAPIRAASRAGDRVVYRPALVGTAKVHHVDRKSGVDHWRELTLLAPLHDAADGSPWDEAEPVAGIRVDDVASALQGAAFAPVPAEALNPKRYASWSKDLAAALYRSHPLEIRSCSALDLVSEPEEAEGAFRARVRHAARERRDLRIEKLRQTYAPKVAALDERIRRAEDRVDRERSQARAQTIQAGISIGASILGALFGRKIASARNVGRATTAARGVGRAAREREDIARAADTVEELEERRAALERELAEEIESLGTELDPESVELDTVSIPPRKSDIAVAAVRLVWLPWRVDPVGIAEPAWR